MLGEFVGGNERFLRLCCNLARFMGLFLLGVFVIVVPISLLFAIMNGFHPLMLQESSRTIASMIGHVLFSGIFLLGIEQLIRCVIEPDFKGNWILHYADKITYAYAGYLFCYFVYSSFRVYGMNLSMGGDMAFLWWNVIPSGIFTFIRILIWVGMGQLLKRLLPIIRESKTLV